MGDLDNLLQDFSYLKSLEHRNEPPKRLAKQLHLPDPSVHHVVRAIFAQTGECTFDRLWHRPLGFKMMLEFMTSPAYKEENPPAAHAIQLAEATMSLGVELCPDALPLTENLITRFVSLPELSLVLKQTNVETLERRLAELQTYLNTDGKEAAAKYVNLKELFAPLLEDVLAYLQDDPWSDFKSSPEFVRYCQWKHLELTQKLTPEDFDIHRIIGRGGFGEVFPCRKRDTGHIFAMKRLDKKRLKHKHSETSAAHERNVLAEMNSKFVTNLKYAFQDRHHLYLILDLLEGGDLQWHLNQKGTFTEQEARFYTAEIMMGLAHIHSRHLIYRDLKPANILLDGKGHARISDLGLARHTKRGLPTSECGTVGYMAPEVLLPQVPYTYTSDLFSLGCVLHELLTGRTPFRYRNDKKVSREETNRLILEEEPEYGEGLPATAQELIAALLVKEPEARLGHNDSSLAAIRKHAFFQEINWAAVVQHRVEPLIHPFQGQVNAHNVNDIDRFNEADTRRITITEEDQRKYYSSFDHTMSHHWQREVLESMYDLITTTADKSEAKLHKKAAALKAKQPAQETSSELLLAGYLKRKTGGLFGKWKRIYVEVTEATLAIRPEAEGPVKQSLDLSSVSAVTAVDDRKAGPLINVAHHDGELLLRCLYTCDFEVWMSTLKQSVASATGQALSRGSKDMMSKKLSESAVNADEAMLTPKPMEATVAPANTTEQLELSAEAESVSPE
eukprot:TRINITY_DN10648_c0_g1_i3.p1 TRINITY_DN10648_c0_g1~~TRINITY_DN10648_c0_g1_i3.p1  ORF type:complete len:732 (+),score=226.70 TRINITY_DN10648_c0_g1_i3:156-2351(+)